MDEINNGNNIMDLCNMTFLIIIVLIFYLFFINIPWDIDKIIN
jgi:hypothetical protein